jgi:hypothetical protein
MGGLNHELSRLRGLQLTPEVQEGINDRCNGYPAQDRLEPQVGLRRRGRLSIRAGRS